MLTLTDTVNYINQALNYPAVTLTDIKLFINQGISELNTTLHICIPDIDTMIAEHRETYINKDNVIVLLTKPTSANIIKPYTEDTVSDVVYDVDNNQFITRGAYPNASFDTLYGVYMDYASGRHLVYKATVVNPRQGMWLEVQDNPLNFDLATYIAKDWVMLFLIPYVCYKYSVRDGDTGILFSEEFAQGFQQLQHSFHIPSHVYLRDVADKPAYLHEVKRLLPELNVHINTRAILEEYRIPRFLNTTYSDTYSHGGWGL